MISDRCVRKDEARLALPFVAASVMPACSALLYALLILATIAMPISAQVRTPRPLNLVPKYANSLLTDQLLAEPPVKAALAKLLGKELAHLRHNVSVTGEIDVVSGFLQISGNAPHMGTEEEGVICISPDAKQVHAAVLSGSTITAHSPTKDYESLTLCIKDWITLANSAHKDRMTRPANVRMANN